MNNAPLKIFNPKDQVLTVKKPIYFSKGSCINIII